MAKKIVAESFILLLIMVLAIVLYSSPKYIELYGNKYLSNSEELDLSGITVSEADEILSKLVNFEKLKKVTFGDNSITKKEKDLLMKKYPDIEFDVISIINMYGKDFKDNIREIDLNDLEIDDDLATYLSYFPKLEKVDLLKHNLTLEEEFKLKEMFPKIEFLYQVPILGVTVPNNVKNLLLSDKNVTDIEKFKKTIELFPNLEYLDMGRSNLTNEELDSLRSYFPNIKVVWTLKLGKWSLKTDAVAFSVLIVTFNYKRMTSEDLEVLKYCTDLQSLDLGHQAITDVSMIPEYAPELRILILSDNKISDISPLTKLKHLHYLELFINKITDWSPITEMKELVDLNICYNRVSDITPFMDLPKLERLWLVGCGVYGEKLKALKEQYPNSVVNISGPGSTGAGWRTHKRYYAMIDMYYKKNYISEEFSKYD